MSTRYRLRERQHQRRMALAYPLAALLTCLVMVRVAPPTQPARARELTVGFPGRLDLLPEIDIQAEERRDLPLTAASRPTAPADFEVFDLDYVETPAAEPAPPRTRAQEPERDTVPRAEPVVPSVQTALRTTSHPVLTRTEVELLHIERPVYPPEAIQLGIEGLVEIVILVDTTGRVAQAHVVNPNRYPVLEQAARAAVQKTVFRVYLIDGKPTAFWVRVPYEFRLVSGG